MDQDVIADPQHARLAQLLRQVASLPEVAMRQARVGEALEAMRASEAVWSIDQLIRHALWGQQVALDALLAAALWLIEVQRRDDYALIQALFHAAHDEGREAVLAMLRDAPPHRSLSGGARLPEARLPFDRDVSLGERRALALSATNPRLLERLLYDTSPLVIERLLRNPLLRLQDVVVIASRRPTLPALLEEVARHRGWIARDDVREALTRNPYSSTGVALKLLVTLRLPTLRQLRDATDLHPALRELARLLVVLREERTAPLRV